MNCNWMIRNLNIKKKMLREAGFDVSALEYWKNGKDPSKRVDAAFKTAGLKMPTSNGYGRP